MGRALTKMVRPDAGTLIHRNMEETTEGGFVLNFFVNLIKSYAKEKD